MKSVAVVPKVPAFLALMSVANANEYRTEKMMLTISRTAASLTI